VQAEGAARCESVLHAPAGDPDDPGSLPEVEVREGKTGTGGEGRQSALVTEVQGKADLVKSCRPLDDAPPTYVPPLPVANIS
jgi:hypothetical protein